MQQRSIELPQGTIHYRESGPEDGEPIVFVHGYLMAGDLWDEVTRRLAADGLRCIAPDWPLGAHRTPMRPDADLTWPGVAKIVAAFLEALDLDGVTLVGNDSGGALCQLVVVHDPGRVGRLVLTPCDAFDNFPPKLFRGLRLAAKTPGGLAAAMQPLRSKAAYRLPITYGWLSHREVPDETIAGWVAPMFADKAIRRDLRKVTAALEPSVIIDTTPRLTEFRKPALVMFATDDKMFPVDHGRRLAKVLPDARFEEVADSMTFVMVDQPERTAALIHDFVRGTRAGAQAPAGSSSRGMAPAGTSPETSG
jgi:pimeloyl-ACP methyl ester carboxylesterase